MAIVQERLPGMMTKFDDRLRAVIQEIQGIIMGADATSRSNERNFFGQQDRLLQLLGTIQGRIPNTLKVIEEWRNNTQMSISEKIPFLMYSLNENITKVEEAIRQKLPDLMRILEEKVPRMLNMIRSKLPQILDIIEQRLPQLLTETEAALPDFLDNIEDRISGIFDLIEGRLPPLLDILRRDLPPIFESLESSLPGILDIIEARIEGLLDTFETTLPQVLDVVGLKLVDVLDMVEGNVGDILGIAAETLPRLLDSLERAVPTILDGAAAMLPGILSTVIEELPGFFDSFQENLYLFENSIGSGISSYLGNTISTCFNSTQEMLPGALAYVATIVDGLQDSITDLLDMIEAMLPQIPGMVDERITDELTYQQQYFAYMKLSLPSLFSSVAELLDSIDGSQTHVWATNPDQGQYPETGPGPLTYGQWNFSIPNSDSLIEIPVLGNISFPGENLLGLLRLIDPRQGDFTSLEPAPPCLGEGKQMETCGLAICPS